MNTEAMAPQVVKGGLEPFVFLDNALRPFLVKLSRDGYPWCFYWNGETRKWLPSVMLKWWKVAELQRRAMPPSLAKQFGRLEGD